MDSPLIFDRPEFGSVRIVEKDGQPWFVARDVCKILGLENTTKALHGLDQDEKSVAQCLTSGKSFNDSRELRTHRKGRDYNAPTQAALDRQFLRREWRLCVTARGKEQRYQVSMVTQRGLEYFANRFAQATLM